MTTPVTILTGFLGSGKTTLLNHMLTAPHGRRIAVVVNEFGDIGLDQKFIARAEGDIVELTNGCVCCAARDDTVEILLSLAKRARDGKGVIDQVVIETTGLAKPASLARFFLGDSGLKSVFHLDGIITVVDAYHGTSQMIQWREVKEQVGVADLILLNKIEMTEEPQLNNIEEWLRGINPIAPIVRVPRDKIPLERMLNVGGFDLHSKERLLSEDEHEHAHDRDVVSISISEERPLDRGKFIRWLSEYVAMDGGDLLRYKGIISFAGAPGRAILQGVHMVNELTDGGPWPHDETPLTELVFIGRRLVQEVVREGIRGSIAR